jgi:hypothetical protein
MVWIQRVRQKGIGYPPKGIDSSFPYSILNVFDGSAFISAPLLADQVFGLKPNPC